jgi:hypothetical protein
MLSRKRSFGSRGEYRADNKIMHTCSARYESLWRNFTTSCIETRENPTPRSALNPLPIWNRLHQKKTMWTQNRVPPRKISLENLSERTVGSRTSYNVLKTRLDAKIRPALHNRCVRLKYSQPESALDHTSGQLTSNCVGKGACFGSSPKTDAETYVDLNTFIPYKTNNGWISRPNSRTTSLTSCCHLKFLRF